MKILVTSDLHGFLPKIDDKFDLLLICGDICPNDCHGLKYQKNFIEEDFVEWIKSLHYNNNDSKVVMVWGNHDFIGEKYGKMYYDKIMSMCNQRLVILNNDLFYFDYINNNEKYTFNIFGTSYCSLFGRWAFMVNDNALEKYFSQIPDNLDILISHDSPNINDLGSITEGLWKNKTTGNKILSKYIKEKKPCMFFSGHFHSGNHEFTKVDDTYMANVSFVNESYVASNKILSINYNIESKLVDNFDYIETK